MLVAGAQNGCIYQIKLDPEDLQINSDYLNDEVTDIAFS